MPKRKPKPARVKISDLRGEIASKDQIIAIRDVRIEQLSGRFDRAERLLIDLMGYLGQQADDAKVIAELLDAHEATNGAARVMTLVRCCENHRARIVGFLRNFDAPVVRDAMGRDEAKAG